jgi:hypothetical protein
MSITPVSAIAAPIPWSKIQEMMTFDRGLQQRSMVFSPLQSMVEFPGIFRSLAQVYKCLQNLINFKLDQPSS